MRRENTPVCQPKATRGFKGVTSRGWVRFVLSIGLAGFSGGAALAGTLMVGSNATAPDQVERTTMNVVVLGLIGPHNASAAATDNSGDTFFAIPGDAASTVQEYDAAQNLINSFVFVAPADLRDSASYIEDLTWGLGGWLWLSTFSGNVYSVSNLGVIQSSFDTGVNSPGVTTDGTFLYTTQGLGLSSPAPNIYKRNASGNVLNTVDTGLNDTLGIGFDPDTGTFWIGGFDMVSNVNSAGTILNQYALDGVHTGLEVDVPEPATILLTGIAAALLFALRRRRVFPGLIAASLGCWAGAGSLSASVTTPTIGSSLVSPQPLGTSITFTASASDTDAGPIRYRYRTRPVAGTLALVRDFSPTTTLIWTPNDTDGFFEIEVTALNTATNSTASASVIFQVTPLATGSVPVVNPTSHPLVALYSAPACPIGSSMRVRFKLVSDVAWQSTNLKPCGLGTMNFYVGGMRATSTYQLRHDVIRGAQITTGPTLTFGTGAVGVTLPAVTQPIPRHAPTSTNDGVTLFEVLSSLSPFREFAVDAAANVIWYNPVSSPYSTRPVTGGTFLQLFGFTTDLKNSGFRETDLVGNLVRETNIERLNAQLAVMGMHPITVVHHDARRLANGNYLALGMTERISTAQGPSADIVGDIILVMDSNLQLLWAWDAFDHLDVTRKAVLNETCTNGPGGCVLFNASVANDWTHGNSVATTPDGNLIYSARHQDWVYKIAYQNGTGDGHVIWKFGKDGDFTWLSGDPYPWQSHQHDPEYVSPTVITLFDNGNTRVGQFGGHSRGQVLTIDELALTITPTMNADVGSYSAALGAAQRLSNGNYEFASGIIQGGPVSTDSVEMLPNGTITSLLHCAASDYRTFRLRDLYSAP